MEPSPTKPEWPKRATVTAGMPYGNKGLHFGHVGGVFVPADCFARFLRDRIGAANVRFISGTDCYGSPIDEGYRKLVEAREFQGTIEEYVTANHDAQKATLSAYGISLSIYEGSGIGQSKEVHQFISDEFVTKLYKNGHLQKRETLQFFDAQAGAFLNGRQVLGRCPVQGCKSEHAYADECDLGHQYAPEDLIAPKSTLSNTVPEMRPVANWYFDLPNYLEYLEEYADGLEQDENIRSVVPQTIKEFLAAPVVFVKTEEEEKYRGLIDELPAHEFRAAVKGKQSFEIEFNSIDDRDRAREVLVNAGIRFRTGKTLVPFRISGNIAWGVKAPVLEDVEGLTIWCWPESLWAPISFSVVLNDKKGLPRSTWKEYWCSDDAEVYQFIGQDNIYFYGVAQPALFEAVKNSCDDESDTVFDRPLKQTKLIANHHMLFGDKKASSSGSVKPPSADELLNYYTFEQLRAHFLALGLDQKSVGFKPKPFDPDLNKREDTRYADPVLKESALLTNVFNRLARSCFYEAQKNFDGYMPLGEVSHEALRHAHRVMLDYDETMYKVELHSIMSIMDTFIRWSNKYWVEQITEVENGNEEKRRQVLIDCFFLLRICTLLMHPIVPAGTEKICDYLCFDCEDFFSWNYDFDNMMELCSGGDIHEGRHLVRELPPRTDFFERHPSQYKNK